MWKLLYIFSILPFIRGADWQDVVEKECDFTSHSGNFLKPGYIYKYRYHVTGNGAAIGTTDVSSEIELNCLIELTAATSCLYNLEVSNCRISAKGGLEGQHKYWIKDQSLDTLMKYPILFSLNNGKLGTIFTSPEDSLISVNIKRGIISGFAISSTSTNSEEKMHRDIHGICPRKTIYKNNRHILTLKDMERCAFPTHPGWHLSPWSFFWNMSFIQHLINSSAKCDYTINARQDELQKVFCHERHAILLDSSQYTANAVQTNIKYELVLESSSRTSIQKTYKFNEMHSSGVEFEYEKIIDSLTQSIDIRNEAQKILSDLIISSQDQIQLRVVPMFHEFVTMLRKSCNLIPFIDSVISCKFLENAHRCNKLQKELALDFLKDALVQCNTACCIKGIRHLITRHQISQIYMNFIFLSWSYNYVPNPTYIEEVLAICKYTKMKLCWLTLGTMIYKYSQEHSEIPQPVMETVAYLSSYISNDCNIDDITFPSEYITTDDKIDYLFTVIKSIGNIGDVARISNHDIVRQLYSCAIAKESTTEISVAAIKAMFRMKPSNYIHKKLLYLMKDKSYSVGIRIAAYDVLINLFNDDELANEIAILFKEEKSKQIKCYLASDIQSMEEEFESNRKSFLHRLKEKLKENKINLDEIHCNPFHHSQSYKQSSLFNLHFLPKAVQEFGSKIDQKMIFEAISALPYASSLNFTAKIFNKYYNLFEYGISAKNWEEFGIWLRRQLSDIDINYGQWLIKNFVEIIQKLGIKGLIPIVSNYGNGKLSFIYPDQKIEENLRKLVKEFLNVNEKQKPSLEIYFKMFGNELGFLSLNSIFSYFTKQYQWLSNQDIVQSLHKGITYNITRSLRLIEAYHLVPTMMGLPLNWTTNCTYIISPRIKIDANVSPGERTENFNIQYSEGFTLQNQMILDFPTVTQIGVQANTSMHTSLRYDFTLHHSDRRHLHEITFRNPQREQIYLEFYRINQQIEHGNYKEIPEDKFERENGSWCTFEYFNEISGIRICYQKSHPKIPSEMKPSIFMSGKIKERYTGQPHDRDLQLYKLQIFNPPTNDRNVYDFKLRFKAQGTKYKRETNVDFNFNLQTKEVQFNVLIPELPDLRISASRSIIHNEDEEETEINHYWILQLNKNKKYEMMYKLKEKIESKITHRGRGRATKEFIAELQERNIDLKTPYNIYQWVSKINVQNHSKRIEALMTFENLEENWNWPVSIFPNVIFERNQKAWIQFESNWETTKNGPEQKTHNTLNIIKTPKRTFQIITQRIQMPGRFKVNANATITEKLTNQCLSFINISYNGWKSGNKDHQRIIHSIDIEIPRYSWNMNIKKESSDFEHLSAITLSRKRIIPLNKEAEYSIGRWEPLQNNDFEFQKWDIKFEGHIKYKFLEQQLLPEKFLQTEYVQDKNQKFPGIETYVDASLKFPFEKRNESLIINGIIKSVYRVLPIDRTSIQWFDSEGSDLSFTLYNTLNNFKREIKAVVGNRQSWINKWLIYNDVLFHGNDKKIEYNLNFLWGEKEKCEYLDFEHTFASSFFTFDSDFLFECNPESGGYHLEFNANTNSPKWDILNVNFKKSLQMDRSLEGWDKLNFNHPYLRIDGEGKIGEDFEGMYYNKKYNIKSKTELFPNAELTYEFKHLPSSRYLELNIKSPGEGLKLANWKIVISRDDKKLSIFGTHIHMRHPGKYNNNTKISLNLLTPFKISLKSYEDLKPIFEFGIWFQSKIDILKESIHAIKIDHNHPIKQLTKSFRKFTKKEEEYIKKIYNHAEVNLKEIQHLLNPFVESTFEMISNIRKTISDTKRYTFDNYETFTLTGEILSDLKIQEYINKILKKLPHEIVKVIKVNINTAAHGDYIVKFNYKGPHWLKWNSLSKLPKTWEGTWRNPIFQFFPQIHSENLFKSRYIVPSFYKTAMIFGPLHVYTFDGKIYEFPKYPTPDCMYMLMHDTRESSFSILTTEKQIYLLFPELTVLLDSDKKIYVNNSNEQSAVPIESSNGKVSVTREGEIIVVNTIGLKVLCDIPRMFCIFTLDPLHHSGIMGLLGNADGEYFNDFVLPNGTIVQTPVELAKGYEVSNHKRCRQLQENMKSEWNDKIHDQCLSVFTHYLSTCAVYLEIDQDIFQEACYRDVSKGENVCFSPDALAGYCTIHGMKTEPCSFKPRWYLKTVDSTHKLEVIIIMDEHYSMFSPGLKGFESLLGAVEDEFRSNGYSSILYSLIGFGGKGIREDPHIITPDINIWHAYKNIISMGQLLKFEGRRKGDALEAIKYATTILPFDMQSSKIIILFTVDDTDTRYSNLKVQYLHKLLDSYSITLYTFADFPSIDKGKKVFGLRADGLIFPQSRRGESFMEFPKTEKAKLTSGTRGSIFLRKFAEANEPYAFYKIAAEEFYAKVKKEVSKTRKCDWTLNHWWDFQNRCYLDN